MQFSVRRPVPADAANLRRFSCYGKGEKFTKVVQNMVRRDLADLVESGEHEDWLIRVADDEAGQLVGIIAWKRLADPEQFFIDVLAVQKSHWREGCGRALKTEAMAISVGLGGRFIVSKVQRQNKRMLLLNASLGIVNTKDPEDGEYRLCAAEITRPGPIRRALRRVSPLGRRGTTPAAG